MCLSFFFCYFSKVENAVRFLFLFGSVFFRRNSPSPYVYTALGRMSGGSPSAYLCLSPTDNTTGIYGAHRDAGVPPAEIRDLPYTYTAGARIGSTVLHPYLLRRMAEVNNYWRGTLRASPFLYISRFYNVENAVRFLFLFGSVFFRRNSLSRRAALARCARITPIRYARITLAHLANTTAKQYHSP